MRIVCQQTILMKYHALLLYWRTLKTQHLDNSFNLGLEKEDRTTILIVF